MISRHISHIKFVKQDTAMVIVVARYPINGQFSIKHKKERNGTVLPSEQKRLESLGNIVNFFFI